tara:strand:+ start:1552 stop:2214 length:663 start_codon:yes stop_codon:yes gene_type:complete
MRIHYLTIATKPHPILENIKKRVIQNKETIHILGENENRNIGWHDKGNFGLKIKLVQEFLTDKELDDNELILFTDAYDVIYYGDFSAIIDKYNTFNKPIIFGAETTCSPDKRMIQYYFNINTKFPFLNSGLYIGKVWALKECLKDYKYNDQHDDQLFWTQTFFQHQDKIELDYNNNLFLNTYGIDIEEISISKSSIYYKGNNPIFLHVNGPDKSDLNKFL